MITKNKLNVFENFEVNRKPKPKEEDEGQYSSNFISVSSGVAVGNWVGDTSNGFNFNVMSPIRSKIHQFKTWIFNPDTYFKSIKNSLNQIENDPSVQNKISMMQDKATELRQTALIEQLKREHIKVENEVILMATEFNKAIDEDVVVLLSEKAPNIHLTWIKNFLRPIPEDVQEKFKKADSFDVFDNYVVMHYGDPKGSVGETEAEVEKRKDPILFGVFQESRRLYYIADWIDEYCDLTLEKLLGLTDMKESQVVLTDKRILDV